MIRNIYFIGIGGIGMSALARYFLHAGMHVAGYDLTETPLTQALRREGVLVHYTDDPEFIPPEFRNPETTLVVYTPAVPSDHRELLWFLDNGFTVEKRSEMLGHVAEGKFTMAVAGTHGKTTTTTLVAWLNRTAATGGTSFGDDNTPDGGSAFLGGISKNFDSNLVLGKSGSPAARVDHLTPCADSRRPAADSRAPVGEFASQNLPRLAVEGDRLPTCADSRRPAADSRAPVGEFASQNLPRLAVEADEFDRSFLRLSPDVAVITSVDADHLDIYGTYEAVGEAFSQFIDRIKPGGAVILGSRVDIAVRNDRITVYRYSLDDPSTDFFTENLRPLPGGYYAYDIVTPDSRIENCTLGITGRINVENSVAAVALMWAAAGIRKEPLDVDRLREGLSTFLGVRRRFDFHVNTPTAAYMDDYAHHPEELSAALCSLRAMFPGRRITALFQPHLYSRTRDLHREFAAALSAADELILTPIYPARELPIEGVSAEMIGRSVTIPWRVVEKERLAETIAALPTDVVVTFGAGNIENHCAEIADAIRNKI